MTWFVGIDGGGTRTTLGLADAEGHELLRRIGPAGLVDPRRPNATAELLVGMIRDAARDAGLEGPATAMCAGLAGIESSSEREIVQAALVREGVAERVSLISDGEAALQGALGDGAGILVIAGTGSVAFGRGETGRLERCGGWGMVLGDEGSGYQLGRAGLQAALRAADGRGMQTQLLPTLLEVLGFSGPATLPSWAGRAEKGEVALLGVHVLRASEQEDRVAREIVMEAALDLGAHVEALVNRLAPWSDTPRVVLHGGLARDPSFGPHLLRVLQSRPTSVRIVEARQDAVGGALEKARQLAAS